MKKMTFALACASTVALFADMAPKATFENYTVGDAVADAVEPDTTLTYWLYGAASGSADGSKVAGDSSAKFLELSTEGGTLWRSINEGNTAGETIDAKLGTAQAIPAAGLFVDTMVQFTPTEDGGAPELGDDDKLAIWLNVTQDAQDTTKSVTNLMVKAGSYDAGGVLGSATYVLSGVTIDAGSWYHLTVKAVDDICIPENQFAGFFKFPAFTIMVDGVELASTTPAFDVSYANELKGNGVLSADMVDAITAGKVFPSCVAGTPGQTATLQAVGFKGSGAIDDLSISDEDPTPAPVVKVDLTISAENATVTGIEDGKVEVGSNLTFTVTANTGYNVTAVKVNGTAVEAGTAGSYSYTVADTDEAVAVVVTTEAIPSIDWDHPQAESGTAEAMFGITGTLATADGVKLAAWAKNVGKVAFDKASEIKTDAFLLNCENTDAAIAEAEKDFVIPAITVGADGKVTVTPPEGDFNGVVTIKGATAVDGDYNLAADAAGAKFFKAFLSLPAAE